MTKMGNIFIVVAFIILVIICIVQARVEVEVELEEEDKKENRKDDVLYSIGYQRIRYGTFLFSCLLQY